ncbi:hypothetical protein AB0F73_07000 [Micromonospora purpureochromogenes]|uniref:hypothetical protein n=1 Tax=Micromonospora purpureochromogenes TaxID=47872 RepID=UPI0033C6F66A
MQRREIDGVTVLEEKIPGPLAGTLSFGCDPRDEDLDTIGLTHVVQELVLRAEPYVADQCTEMTALSETSFTAAGSPVQIAEHFAAICTVLNGLPPADLADALADADPGDRYLGGVDDGLHDPWGSLLARRYGPRGPGLARWPVVDYRLFTADEIGRHVRTFFTAGNAVLALTAAAPPAMRLPLPTGPRVTHPTPSGRYQSGPVWYADQVRGAGLAFRAEPDAAAIMLLRVLMSRVDTALARAGLPYASYPEFLAHDAALHEYGLILRTRQKKTKGSDAATAAEILWAEMQRLIGEGPSQADLDREIAFAEAPPVTLSQLRKEPPDVLERVGPLESAAQRELFGTTEFVPPDPPDRLRRFTAEAARDLMAGWLSSAMVVVPHGTRPALPGTAEQACPRGSVQPSGEVYRPALLKRLGSKGVLIVSSDSVATVDGDGDVHMVPLADALLIEWDGRFLLAHPGHGCVTDISGYSAAIARLRSVLPPRRVRQEHRL